jgi:hypothetical protein
MACRPCQWTGEQLPDNVTCGSSCEEFPRCLPPPSPELLATIVQVARQDQADHENHRATAETLELLYRAITEGLSGRQQRGGDD